MDEIFLDAEIRGGTGRAKVKDLRDAGFIPAVVYSEGKVSKPLKVSHSQLVRLVHQHRLENAVINLRIKDDGKEKTKSCLIKEIQYHPVKEDIIHVDFNEISLTKVIKINVPVVAKGDPIGVKQEGGSLEHILWEIEVECLPVDIPKEIEVDVSNLKIGDSVHVKDVTFPPKVKVLSGPETILLSVAAPIKEEVLAVPAEGEEKQEPEVIKEKKEAPVEEAPEGKEKK
jgi:large subunit ribosomal protein L25